MSKILITGDWHVKKGIQSQLIVDYLDYLENYYFENELDYIFVIGDVFHKSSNIKNDAFVPLFMKLLQMKNNGVKFIFVVGNHDVYNVDYDTVVDTFSPIGDVIKEHRQMEIDDFTFDFVPYTKNPDDIPSGGDFLITHVPIANFSFDNAYRATEKNAFPFDLFEDYSLVFTGHFHRHQHQKNIVYVGAPNQHFRSEAGQEKGFVVFDTQTESWEFVEYDEAPVYIEIGSSDIKNIKDLDIKGNFVVVYIDEKIQDFAKLKYVLYEYGAIDIIPIFLKEDDNVEVEEFSGNKDIEDIAREFIGSIEDVDNKRLLDTFEKVLEKT